MRLQKVRCAEGNPKALSWHRNENQWLIMQTQRRIEKEHGTHCIDRDRSCTQKWTSVFRL